MALPLRRTIKYYHFYWEIFDFINNYALTEAAAFICGNELTATISRQFITNPYVDVFTIQPPAHYKTIFNMIRNYECDILFMKSDMMPLVRSMRIPKITFYVSRQYYLFNPDSINDNPNILKKDVLKRLYRNDVDDIKLLNAIRSKSPTSLSDSSQDEIESTHDCSICYETYMITQPIARCCGKAICLTCINKQSISDITKCAYCRQEVKYYFNLNQLSDMKKYMIDEFVKNKDEKFYRLAVFGSEDIPYVSASAKFITDPVNLADLIDCSLIVYQPKLLFKYVNLNIFFQLRPRTNIDIIIIN
jgi:hypothetical protein